MFRSMVGSHATVDAEWLISQKGNSNVKILDVAYSLKPKPNFEEFKLNYYGQFSKLIADKTNEEYLAEHPTGAGHFNLDIAHYPEEYERFGLYPAPLFQEYIRHLGVNEGDHVVLVGRGPAVGMLFAARAWWTFRVYGHTSVSVLSGGLEAWKSAGGAIESGSVKIQPGNWSARQIDTSMIMTFDALTTKDLEGESMFDKCEQFNYLDARQKEQFTGESPLGLEAKHATGSHVRGAKSLPLSEIMCPTGIKPADDVNKALLSAGFVADRPTVVACNGGIQAALLALALHQQGHKTRLYNGSMLELAARASHLINGVSKK